MKESIVIRPQPSWEEDPSPTSDGSWAARYRDIDVNERGEPVEVIEVDERKPPGPEYFPVFDGEMWLWATCPGLFDPPRNNWRVINAGGSDRMAFVFGQWMYPRFATHDACLLWWRKYCQQNPNEHTPWAITEKP